MRAGARRAGARRVEERTTSQVVPNAAAGWQGGLAGVKRWVIVVEGGVGGWASVSPSRSCWSSSASSVVGSGDVVLLSLDNAIEPLQSRWTAFGPFASPQGPVLGGQGSAWHKRSYAVGGSTPRLPTGDARAQAFLRGSEGQRLGCHGQGEGTSVLARLGSAPRLPTAGEGNRRPTFLLRACGWGSRSHFGLDSCTRWGIPVRASSVSKRMVCCRYVALVRVLCTQSIAIPAGYLQFKRAFPRLII